MTGNGDGMRLVLDASAAVNVVLGTSSAQALIARLEAAHLVLAPALFHGEVANTLWKYLRAGELDRDAAIERYEEAIGLVDAFEPDAVLATEALAAAARHGHPVYDLLYLVTATRHGCRLLTADRRLAALARSIDPGLLA